MPIAQIYDASDSILAQKIAQIPGVGQVFTWGGSRPAVRVQVNPQQLNSYGISLETVRKALQSANSNLAKGTLSNDDRAWTLSDTDQLFKAYEYEPLIVAGHAGAPVRLSDIAIVNGRHTQPGTDRGQSRRDYRDFPPTWREHDRHRGSDQSYLAVVARLGPAGTEFENR
jgi:multidrug efflux pump subunit AcrB